MLRHEVKATFHHDGPEAKVDVDVLRKLLEHVPEDVRTHAEIRNITERVLLTKHHRTEIIISWFTSTKE